MSKVIKINQTQTQKNISPTFFEDFTALVIEEAKEVNEAVEEIIEEDLEQEKDDLEKTEEDFNEEVIDTQNAQSILQEQAILDEEDKKQREDEFLQNLQKMKEDIIQKANIEAQNIIDEAKKTIEKTKQDAYNLAYKEGEEKGFDESFKNSKDLIEKEMKKSIKALEEKVVDEIELFSDEKERLLEVYIEDLKDIAIAIGEKIVNVSLKSNKEVVEKMILQAIEKMKKTSWAKVYIGMSGEAVNVKSDTEFLDSLSRLAENVKVIIMQEDEDGTCIIETPDGILDISVKTQIENIKEVIKTSKS